MDKSLMPKAYSSHVHWYVSTLNSLSTNSDHHKKPLKIGYTYDNAIHGFSALLSKAELESLKKSPGFLSAYSDRSVTLNTTHTTKFLSLNPITGLWPASNYGKDIIVGVLDSGVWPESHSFKDDGMTDVPAKWNGVCEFGQDVHNSSFCNKKLIGVRFFNQGLLASAATPDSSENLYSGRDYDGHGTHTSSTVAENYVEGATFFGYASGTARGVAPRARVAMYKVSWYGGTIVSDIIAGMDQAIADGVDIISISLGWGNVALYEDPIAIASFGAMEKGVLVSSSSGNDRGIWTLHNGSPWVLTVAAGSIDRYFAGILNLGNGFNRTGWTLFPVPALVKDLPLIYNKTLSYCNSSETLSAISDGIVICQNGDVYDQMDFISRSNAHARIYISDDPQIFEGIFDFNFNYNETLK